mgnify:CR=1 FL=1
MTHLDLFSGIGGFALAADMVWGRGNVEHIFCEVDPFCKALLAKRFEGSMIFDDIRTLRREGFTTDADGDGLQEQRPKQQTGRDRPDYKIDLLTGGFPCQPFSQAGKRKGRDDDRHLWPEMLRVIWDFKPTWVIAENVRGILTIEGGMVFEQVCLDLEASGYEVQAFVIPACAVNAPHRRDRVWIIAHDKGENNAVSTRGNSSIGADSDVVDTSVGNPQSAGQQGGIDRQGQMQYGGTSSGGNKQWEQNWLEVATELCGVDDGLPAELDGLKLSKSRHRVEQLKALGNSIVPQVAAEIMRAIREVQ